MNRPNKKKAHLLGFIQHGVNSHATGMWRHPKDKVRLAASRRIGVLATHGAARWSAVCSTPIFIADELAPYNTHEDSSDPVVKWAVQCPTHEPSTIVPIIAAATRHLGVGRHACRPHSSIRIRCADDCRASIISLDGQDRVEHRFVLLEERMGCLRTSP